MKGTIPNTETAFNHSRHFVDCQHRQMSHETQAKLYNNILCKRRISDSLLHSKHSN